MHLIVLSHGFMGWSNKMSHFKDIFSSIDSVDVLVLTSNSTSIKNIKKTLDGIKEGSKRIVEEIKEYLQHKEGKYQYISLIGFSLGGIYMRYVASLAINLSTNLF